MIQGRVALGTRLLSAAGRIATDRLQEVRGRALPRTPEQLAQPDVVNALLEEAARYGAPPLPRVEHVRLPGVEFESSNCRNFLIEVEFGSDRASGRGSEPGSDAALPKTLYVKMPCAELGTRAFANATGFWESEVEFCARVAPRVPIRVPRAYAAVRRGSRFVLLLENLHETSGTRLFINRDMAAGTTVERARVCIEAFAELHAAFWDLPGEEREALLPIRLHTYLAPGARERNRALNAASIAPAHRAAPDVFTERHVAICKQAIEKWDALLEFWYSGPLTLIHGDSHLANCFEYPTEAGPKTGMIDFQGIQWCKGIRDVQYFLINSLDASLLASNEQELIGHYLDSLASFGVTLAPDDARQQFRAFAFQTLMVAVVSLGLGSLTERSETVMALLERSVAAIDRLQFGEWLEQL